MLRCYDRGIHKDMLSTFFFALHLNTRAKPTFPTVFYLRNLKKNRQEMAIPNLAMREIDTEIAASQGLASSPALQRLRRMRKLTHSYLSVCLVVSFWVVSSLGSLSPGQRCSWGKYFYY
jgi:hypothetical protein